MWKKYTYFLLLSNIRNTLSPECVCQKRYVNIDNNDSSTTAVQRTVHPDDCSDETVSVNGSVIAQSARASNAGCSGKAQTSNLPTLVEVIVRSISHSEYPRRIQWQLPRQDNLKHNTKEDAVENVECTAIHKSEELHSVEYNNKHNDNDSITRSNDNINKHMEVCSNNSEYVSYRRSPYSLLRSRNERVGLCATRLLRNVPLELKVQLSSGKAANKVNDINTESPSTNCVKCCEHCKSKITHSRDYANNISNKNSAICCCLSLLYKQPILSEQYLQPKLRREENAITEPLNCNNSFAPTLSESSKLSSPPTINALKIMPSSSAAEEDSSLRYAVDTFILALHLSNALELLLSVIDKDDETALFAGMNLHTASVLPLCNNLTPHIDVSTIVNSHSASGKSSTNIDDNSNAVENDAIWSARLLLPIEEANHIRWLQNEHEHLRHCYSRAQSLRSLFVMESICTSKLVKGNKILSSELSPSINQDKRRRRAHNMYNDKYYDNDIDDDDHYANKMNWNKSDQKDQTQTRSNGERNEVHTTNSINVGEPGEKKEWTKYHEEEQDWHYISNRNNHKVNNEKSQREIPLPLYISSQLCNRSKMLNKNMSQIHCQDKPLSDNILADNYYVYTTATPSLAEIRTVLRRMHKQECVISLVDIALLERWTLHWPELEEELFTFATELMNKNFSVLHETPSPALTDFAQLFAALIVEHYATHLLSQKNMSHFVDKADEPEQIIYCDQNSESEKSKVEKHQSKLGKFDDGVLCKSSSQCCRSDGFRNNSNSNNNNDDDDDYDNNNNNSTNWRTRHQPYASIPPLQFLECCTKLIHLYSSYAESLSYFNSATKKASESWLGQDACARLTSSVLNRLKQKCDAIASSCLLEATNVECNKWVIWLLQSNPVTEHCMKQFRLLTKQSVSSAHSALASSHLIPYAYYHLEEFVTVLLPLVVNSESEELFTITLNECLSHLELRVRELATPFTEEELHLLAKIGNYLFDNVEASRNYVLHNVKEHNDDSVMWKAEELNVMDGGPWALCVSTCKALRKMLQSLIEDKEYLHNEEVTNEKSNSNSNNNNSKCKWNMLSSQQRNREYSSLSSLKDQLFSQIVSVRTRYKLDSKENENAYNDLHHVNTKDINSSTNHHTTSGNDAKKLNVESENNNNHSTVENLHEVNCNRFSNKTRKNNRGEINVTNKINMSNEPVDEGKTSEHCKMKTCQEHHSSAHINSVENETRCQNYVDCKKLYVSDAIRRRFLSLIENIVKQHVHLQRKQITTSDKYNDTTASEEFSANSLISKDLFTFISNHVTVTNIHDEYRRKLFLLVNVSPNELKAHNEEQKEVQHEKCKVIPKTNGRNASTIPATSANKEHESASNVKTNMQASQIISSDLREVECIDTNDVDDDNYVGRIPVELRLLVNSLPFFFSSWASATILREVLAESSGNNPRYNYVLDAAINLQLPISTTRSRIASTLNMWRFINSQAEKLSWRESIRCRQRCIYNLPLSFILSSYWAFITWTCIAAIVLLNLCGIDYESNVVAQRLYNKFALWPELYYTSTSLKECKDANTAKDERKQCDWESQQEQQQQELQKEELAAIETCKIYFGKEGNEVAATVNNENNNTTSVPNSTTSTEVVLTDSAMPVQEPAHPRALTMVRMNNAANANIVLSKFSDGLIFPFYVDVNKMMPLDALVAHIVARIRFITLSHCGFLSRFVIRFFPLERQAMQNNLITHTCIQADRWGRWITFLMYIHENVTITNGFIKALRDSVLAKRANLIVFVHERSLEDQHFDDTIVIQHPWQPVETTSLPELSEQMNITSSKDHRINNVSTAMLLSTIRTYMTDYCVELSAKLLTFVDLFHYYISFIRLAVVHSISRATVTYNRLKGGMLQNTELRNSYLHALTFHQPAGT